MELQTRQDFKKMLLFLTATEPQLLIIAGLRVNLHLMMPDLKFSIMPFINGISAVTIWQEIAPELCERFFPLRSKLKHTKSARAFFKKEAKRLKLNAKEIKSFNMDERIKYYSATFTSFKAFINQYRKEDEINWVNVNLEDATPGLQMSNIALLKKIQGESLQVKIEYVSFNGSSHTVFYEDTRPGREGLKRLKMEILTW